MGKCHLVNVSNRKKRPRLCARPPRAFGSPAARRRPPRAPHFVHFAHSVQRVTHALEEESYLWIGPLRGFASRPRCINSVQKTQPRKPSRRRPPRALPPPGSLALSITTLGALCAGGCVRGRGAPPRQLRRAEAARRRDAAHRPAQPRPAPEPLGRPAPGPRPRGLALFFGGCFLSAVYTAWT